MPLPYLAMKASIPPPEKSCKRNIMTTQKPALCCGAGLPVCCYWVVPVQAGPSAITVTAAKSETETALTAIASARDST